MNNFCCVLVIFEKETDIGLGLFKYMLTYVSVLIKYKAKGNPWKLTYVLYPRIGDGKGEDSE